MVLEFWLLLLSFICILPELAYTEFFVIVPFFLIYWFSSKGKSVHQVINTGKINFGTSSIELKIMQITCRKQIYGCMIIEFWNVTTGVLNVAFQAKKNLVALYRGEVHFLHCPLSWTLQSKSYEVKALCILNFGILVCSLELFCLGFEPANLVKCLICRLNLGCSFVSAFFFMCRLAVSQRDVNTTIALMAFSSIGYACLFIREDNNAGSRCNCRCHCTNVKQD